MSCTARSACAQPPDGLLRPSGPSVRRELFGELGDEVGVTTLHEKPSGPPCQACTTLQLARTVMTDGSGRSRPPLSGDDIGPCPDCDTPDPQP
jgi:hypothetical protein